LVIHRAEIDSELWVGENVKEPVPSLGRDFQFGNGLDDSVEGFFVRFAAGFPMSESGQFRTKDTDLENVVPAVSTWPKERLRKFRYTDLDGNEVRLDPVELVHLDPFPMPKPVDREGYATEENSDRYWSSGAADWRNVSDAIDRHMEWSEPFQLLDFGCASGRFLRHAFTQSEKANVNCWGCDLAPANINWIRRHLPKEIECLVNSSDPKLPIEDDVFDIVTAFSVFTHIDHQEVDWLLELKRITKPGGLLYLTIHNDATWKRVPTRAATLRQFEHQNKFEENLKIDPSMFSEPMPKERFAFFKDREAVYNCNVWHTDQYIRRAWGKHLEIVAIADCAHSNFQTPIIMRV